MSGSLVGVQFTSEGFGCGTLNPSVFTFYVGWVFSIGVTRISRESVIEEEGCSFGEAPFWPEACTFLVSCGLLGKAGPLGSCAKGLICENYFILYM